MSRFRTDDRRRQPWRPHLTEPERQRLAKLDQRIDEGRRASKERVQLIDLVARRAHRARMEKKVQEAQK